MDHLEIAIKSLSPKERTLLLERLKTQKKKSELFNFISKTLNLSYDPREIEVLSKKLGYHKSNLNNLYTLRNRLHNDITDVKMSLIRNRLIKAKEVVHSLRTLIYSKDPVTVIRELKRQEKNAIELELFDELSEIYFCFFLLYRHDIRKSVQYLKVKAEFDEKRTLHQRLEVLFYSKLLDTQDLIYRFNEQLFSESRVHLAEAEQIYRQLNSLSAEFLYLSGKLTLHLNSRDTITDPVQVKKDLDRLNDIYHSSFLIYKYPNCTLAIKSLFSRFYFLTGQYELFENINLEVQRRIAEYKDYPMFSCTYFYYVYASLHYTLLRGSHDYSWLKLINANYISVLMENMSDQAMVNLLYLKAITSIAEQKPKKAIGELEEARMHFNKLSRIAGWVVEEIILLQVLLQIGIGDFDIVEQQLKNYKRRKTNKQSRLLNREISKADINLLQKAVGAYEKEGDLAHLIAVLQNIKSKYALLKPIDIRQVLK